METNDGPGWQEVEGGKKKKEGAMEREGRVKWESKKWRRERGYEVAAWKMGEVCVSISGCVSAVVAWLCEDMSKAENLTYSKTYF